MTSAPIPGIDLLLGGRGLGIHVLVVVRRRLCGIAASANRRCLRRRATDAADDGNDTSTVDAVGEPQLWTDAKEAERHPPVPGQWFAAALEEYRSLRIEIVDAIGAQRRIMQLGVASETALVGFGLQGLDPFAAAALLGLVVPVVGLFITAGAMGELARAVRASAFLLRREAEISRMAGVSRPPAMAWESWLRDMPRVLLRDRAEFAVLFVIMLTAVAMAVHRSAVTQLWTWPTWPYLVAGGIASVVSILATPTLLAFQLRRAGALFDNKRGRSWQTPPGPATI